MWGESSRDNSRLHSDTRRPRSLSNTLAPSSPSVSWASARLWAWHINCRAKSAIRRRSVPVFTSMTQPARRERRGLARKSLGVSGSFHIFEQMRAGKIASEGLRDRGQAQERHERSPWCPSCGRCFHRAQQAARPIRSNWHDPREVPIRRRQRRQRRTTLRRTDRPGVPQ
jgi:hypothetical protein